MHNQELPNEDNYESLPYLDDRFLDKDFMEFYRDTEEWDVFESRMLDAVINNPGWLLTKELETGENAIKKLRETLGLDIPIKERMTGVDERVLTSLYLRAIDIFSKDKGFKYLWRAGNFTDAVNPDHEIVGTFDISFSQTEEHYKNGLSGERSRPCYIRLSIESLVNKYVSSKRNDMIIIFEHGIEGMFESIEVGSTIEGLDISVFKDIKRAENPSNHQIAMEVVEIDDKTLEIHWVQRLKHTRFTAIGPQREMYNFLKKKCSGLKTTGGLGFFILTDEDGNPTEIGDIGGQKNSVKLIEETS